MPEPTCLSGEATFRIVRSLLAAELTASGRDVPTEEVVRWQPSLSVRGSGLALDSLERLQCAAATSEFFHLHEAGIEDYLLTQKDLAGWVSIVEAALAEGLTGVTFRTSGTTGPKRSCTHGWTRLRRETSHWAGMFADRTRLVSLVPAHHIYGFLFTALLPDLLGVSVLDARDLSPGSLRRELREGDLLVGHPTVFAAMVRSLGDSQLAQGVYAVSSTAALPVQTQQSLRAMGIARVVEIYGSSETAGIAERSGADSAFRLLPLWRPGKAGGAASVIDVVTGREVPLADRASWDADGGLRLLGRKDFAVQVGGMNVYPVHVAARIREHPVVVDCVVRLDEGSSEPRLKAFVVPAPGLDSADVVGQLRAWCSENLPAVERPVRIDVGPFLPQSELGKPSDWQHAA